MNAPMTLTTDMTPAQLAKPASQTSEVAQPYWDAAARGELVLQHCAHCDAVRHYPRLLCSVCYSEASVFKPSTGGGKVHSWTVAHHAFHPAFAAELPYTLVTVDLHEGVRALGRWHGDCLPVIDAPVSGRFEVREGGVDLIFTATCS
jgi:uncharacterized OB-fold protein